MCGGSALENVRIVTIPSAMTAGPWKDRKVAGAPFQLDEWDCGGESGPGCGYKFWTEALPRDQWVKATVTPVRR
jgi:hypothetical protein